MIVAITGATGFIGRCLVNRHLEMGDEVRVLTRKLEPKFPNDVKIYNYSLLNKDGDLIKFVDGADILYHCAAEIRDETIMYEVNVEGTANLIEAAKNKVKRWVQLSSTGVYGPVFKGIVNEKQNLNPINTYEKSKVESDSLVISAGKRGYFNYTIMRPSNVFGPDMINKSLFQFIKAIDKGLFFFIGKEGANANYVPVENVVHALVLAGKSDIAIGKTYNISDYLELERFVEVIAKLLNVPVPSFRVPLVFMKVLGKIGDMVPKSPLTTGRVLALTNRVIYENTLLENELGYSPIISIEDGVHNLVNRYKIEKL